MDNDLPTTGPPGRPLPVLDYEAFRPELAEFQMTPEQEQEFLDLLWETGRMAVDISLGLDTAQLIFPALKKMVGPDSENDVEPKKQEKTETERSQS